MNITLIVIVFIVMAVAVQAIAFFVAFWIKKQRLEREAIDALDATEHEHQPCEHEMCSKTQEVKTSE